MKNNKESKGDFIPFSSIKNDLPAGLVVFLVALPLCLGIALASGAPLFSGLITGIVGGIVVSTLSGSQLSVSGPAAGLTVIVINAITTLGSYEAFLLAVVLAGAMQIILGVLKAGTIGNYFPSSVIKGMLAAIGIILIRKQLSYAFGYNANGSGGFTFIHSSQSNVLVDAINNSNLGALIICLVSLFILIIWEKPVMKKIKIIPAPLVVVVFGIIINYVLNVTGSMFMLNPSHLVQIPVLESGQGIASLFTLPDFSQFTNVNIYVVAVTLAIVASLETLLSVEAIDKLDPMKRNTPTDRELKAQGAGNIVAGLLGGLPMTAVIVRGSANVASGGKTKASAFLHGCFLLLAVLLIPRLINQIPLASLAAVLLVVGYKLTKVSLYKAIYKTGWDQFIPFAVTVLAIVFTDLLKGIGIGMAVGIFFILKRSMKYPYFFTKETHDGSEIITVKLAEEVSFLNKASVMLTLDQMPEGVQVIIDGSNSRYIDYDVLESIYDFKENAHYKNITVKLIGINEVQKVAVH